MRVSLGPALAAARRVLAGGALAAGAVVAGALAATAATATPAAAQAVSATVRYDGLGPLRGLNNTGVGPLHGTLLALPGLPAVNAKLTLFCVDMYNGEVAGLPFSAFLTPLDGSAPLAATTRQGALFADALTRYRKAAWLTDQFAWYPEQAGGLQGAIWTLFTPLQPPYVPTPRESADMARWTAAADAFAASPEFASHDWGRYRVVTDVAGVGRAFGGTQEFISTVPEPGSVALVGLGLVAVGAAGARRRRQARGA